MFNNPGKKLKSLAKVIFWLSIIIYTLAAVGAYLNEVEINSASGSTIGLIIVAVLWVLIGLLIGWLSSILVYAFGELIEDVHSMRKKISRIEYKLSKIPVFQGEIDESYIEDDEE